MLKWILPTFDVTAAMLQNFLIILNPRFAHIFGNIFSSRKLTLSLMFAISPAMI